MMGMGESRNNASQAAAMLRQGLETIDLNQEIVFQAYTRVVLPIDGYVFWSRLNTITVRGYLHASTEFLQNEDETLGYVTVLFTSEKKVTVFEDSPPNTLYVATQGKYRYAFSAQHGFNFQSELWHYFGHSVMPALAAQLLDTPGQIDPRQAVVSNSLPLWLALNDYVCPYYDGFSNSIPLYPSFLTPPNLLPSYGAVHIGDEDTTTPQSAPLIDPETRSHSQLAYDSVRITLYGLQNNAALDFQDCVMQYTVDTGNFGIRNMAVVRDAKRPQTELQAISMKKTILFDICYYQNRAAEIAMQMITSCVPTFTLGT